MIFKQGISRAKEDYKEFGLSEQVEIWEDGIRTSGGKGFYEWWYNDFSLEDGTTIVVIFFTKNGFDVKGPASPMATISITYPNGDKVGAELLGERHKVIDASPDHCDVKVKGAHLKYKEGLYYLTYHSEKIFFDVIMTPTLPMWRPGTGHFFFSEDKNDYFAWLVPVPSCDVKGMLKVDDKSVVVKGKGYHDHNWGNRPMNELINHWYWGRGHIGPYNLIACDIISGKKYGFKRIPVMMIAKDGDILESNEQLTNVERGDTFQHPLTKKFMDDKIIFTHEGVENYKITYDRKDDILVYNLLDMVSFPKRTAAKAIGMNPTFARVLGEITLEVGKGDDKTIFTDKGLWEQMFFGSNKTCIINE